MTEIKYELTGDTLEIDGRTLHRIRALRDIGDDVYAGDLGGYVEAERNLSQLGNAQVYGNAGVYGNVQVGGDARVYGNAQVYGNAGVYGNAQVGGDARIMSADHLFVAGPIGPRGDYTTFFRAKAGYGYRIMVTCGFFEGDLEAFLAAVRRTYGDNRYAREYRAAAELARVHIDLTADADKQEAGVATPARNTPREEGNNQ